MNTEPRELTIVQNAQKSISFPRDEKPVFPLMAMHRKELRKLRDANIGELRTKIRFIKSEKLAEFEKKFFEVNKEKIDALKIKYTMFNTRMRKALEPIRKNILMLQKEVRAFEIENKTTVEMRGIIDAQMWENSDSDFMRYNRAEAGIEEYHFKRISEKLFKERISKAFTDADEMVTNMNGVYEEAINFGDLEQVKDIYYQLKNADLFLDSIITLKISKEVVLWNDEDTTEVEE